MQNSRLKCTKSRVIKDVADLEYELKKDKGNTAETMQIHTLLESSSVLFSLSLFEAPVLFVLLSLSEFIYLYIVINHQ